MSLQCVNVRLPQELGRMKGFGYAEFVDRATLIEALTLNDSVSLIRFIRFAINSTQQSALLSVDP